MWGQQWSWALMWAEACQRDELRFPTSALLTVTEQNDLCYGGCPECYRMFNGIPGLYTPGVSSTCTPHSPLWQAKMSPDIVMALKGQNPLAENHWTKLRTLNIILGYRLLRLGDMVRYTSNLGHLRLGDQYKDSQFGCFNHLGKRLWVTVEMLKKGCPCYSNSKT